MSVKQKWKNVMLLLQDMLPVSNYNQGRLEESDFEGQVLSLVYWRRDLSEFEHNHDYNH